MAVRPYSALVKGFLSDINKLEYIKKYYKFFIAEGIATVSCLLKVQYSIKINAYHY